jgi:hypothetical protein
LFCRFLQNKSEPTGSISFSQISVESKIEKVSHFRQTGEVLPILAKPDTKKEYCTFLLPLLKNLDWFAFEGR